MIFYSFNQAFFLANAFVIAFYVVENDFGSNTWNRKLASRVDFGEPHFVGDRKSFGKLWSEVLSTRIKVWLEDHCQASFGI